MFQALFVYFDHMHKWKVSGCSNHGSIPFFDVVAAYFWMICLGIWKYDMLDKCNVFVLEARIRSVWGITTLSLSPMGMGWMTWWYFGAPCWFYNLKRSHLSSYYSKLHWSNCEMKIIPIRITIVKWWLTTGNGRRQTQYSGTICGC